MAIQGKNPDSLRLTHKEMGEDNYFIPFFKCGHGNWFGVDKYQNARVVDNDQAREDWQDYDERQAVQPPKVEDDVWRLIVNLQNRVSFLEQRLDIRDTQG